MAAVEQRPFSKGATIVVAASDSLDKSGAKYICDGTDDQEEINAAISDLPAGGGEVQLLEGTFSITAEILLTDYIKISGCGRNTILKIPNGHNTNIKVIHITAHYCQVENLCIDGNKANQTAGTMNGIYLDSGKNHIINNVFISNMRTNGIETYNVSGYNRISNVYIAGCVINFNIASTSLHNTLVGCISLGSGSYGIIIASSCHYNTISGCVVKDSTTQGINVDGNYNTISGCTVEGGSANGIVVPGNRNTITGCVIDGCSQVGIVLTGENCVAGNNVVKGCGWHGIITEYDDAYRNIIIGNQIFLNNRYAIWINANARDCAAIGNYCYANSQTAHINYDNICLNTPYNCLVEGNICRKGGEVNKPRYGIFINTSMIGAIIRNNDVRGGGDTADFYDSGASDNHYSDQHNDQYQDIRAEATNYIHTAVGTGGEFVVLPAAFAGSQIDCPRNVTVSCTAVGAPSGDVIIDGLDAKGNTIQETFTVNPGGKVVGDYAFSQVTQITIPAGIPGGDTVTIGIGSKLGLANIIYATADVYKIKKNMGDLAAAGFTVNLTYHTVDVSTGGAVNNDDDFTIWYRTNLNIIG